MNDFQQLASRLGQSHRSLAVGESCTGGLLGHQLTDIPGSSSWFFGGVICYHNKIKEQLLEVPKSVLTEHGAVSEPVVRQMAQAVRAIFGSDYGVGISGVAGPGGGSVEKPVGTVYLAAASAERTLVICEHFSGERSAIKQASALAAAQLVLRLIDSPRSSA